MHTNECFIYNYVLICGELTWRRQLFLMISLNFTDFPTKKFKQRVLHSFTVIKKIKCYKKIPKILKR